MVVEEDPPTLEDDAKEELPTLEDDEKEEHPVLHLDLVTNPLKDC
tara:strand:- start:381 stop:515 length:135 start_codon:yes stop_codon:yes gene_type:complete